jgi:signal transduction histidine kinase
MFASAAMLICLASYWMLQRSLDATEYHDLQERAEDVQLILAHAGAASSLDQLRADFAAFYAYKDDGKYLQVRDDHGNWLFRSRRLKAANPMLSSPDQIPAVGLISEFRIDDDLVRVLSYAVTVNGRKYAVQTGMSLDRPLLLLLHFRTNMFLLTPAVILLAGIGGYFMSRKALYPVALLATEAQRINERNLHHRLPVSEAKDELSALCRTLNNMLERIDKAFTSVRTFTGNASHELRTPIALLRTEIEVALYRPRDTEEYRAILGRLHAETVRMTSLVENLLSLARADGGAETIVLAPTRLETLFGQVAETWKNATIQAMLDFRVELPESDLVVLADAPGIKRMLSILLDNACKYTPPGGVVTLRADSVGGRAEISVQDSGIGIDPVYKERVFDRFFRVPGNTPLPPGSGLGLSLAKWIAERHGTQLHLESVPEHGSRFSFSLELSRCVQPAIHGSPTTSDSEKKTSVPSLTHSQITNAAAQIA